MILCTYFKVKFLTSYIMGLQTWEVVCVKVKPFSDIPFFYYSKRGAYCQRT